MKCSVKEVSSVPHHIFLIRFSEMVLPFWFSNSNKNQQREGIGATKRVSKFGGKAAKRLETPPWVQGRPCSKSNRIHVTLRPISHSSPQAILRILFYRVITWCGQDNELISYIRFFKRYSQLRPIKKKISQQWMHVSSKQRPIRENVLNNETECGWYRTPKRKTKQNSILN